MPISSDTCLDNSDGSIYVLCSPPALRPRRWRTGWSYVSESNGQSCRHGCIEVVAQALLSLRYRL